MRYLQEDGPRTDYVECRANPWWDGEPQEFLPEVRFTDDATKVDCDKRHRPYPYPEGFLYLSASWEGQTQGDLGKRHLMARLAPEVAEWASSMLIGEDDHMWLQLIRRRRSICLYANAHLTSGGRCVAEWPAEDLGKKWNPGGFVKVETLGLTIATD